MRTFWRFACGLLLFPAVVTYGQTPVQFVENRNQWPADIDFVANVPGGRMAVAATSLRYTFLDYQTLEDIHHQAHEPDGLSDATRDIRGHAVFVDFVGANSDARPTGWGRSDAYRNYYLGNDRSRWAERAYAFTGVMYESIYPGVDLKVYAYDQHVKYDFIVAPGANPAVIASIYTGADELVLDNGDLAIHTSLGDIIEKKPVAWQWIDGKQVDVPCSFQLDGNRVSFGFPEGFDACYELLIDPLLIFSTFSGSTADNWGSTATPGERGVLYSAGVTSEVDGGRFPASPGAYQQSTAGLYDIGILKYDSTGAQLLHATYLGGSANESPHSLIVNAANELLLLGTTSSSDFPITDGAFQDTFRGGVAVPNMIGYPYAAGCDMFISRFSMDGAALLGSTFVGGSGNDGINPPGGFLTRNYGDQLRGDIITDEANNIYVSSVTSSANFPVAQSFGMTYSGGETDAVIFKMSPDLSSMVWSGMIGGSASDAAYSIKIGTDESVFAAGGTISANFPTTVGSYQTGHKGDVDGWIARIAADGSSILNGTLTGTAGYNQVYFLDLNDTGEVYVYGQTTGTFPITPGIYHNPNSGQFIQKFTHELDELIFSTVFGAGRGVPDISPTAFLVNDCNNLYVAGWGGRINREAGYWQSGTTGMTTTPDAFQLTTQGSDFYFLVLTDDAKERLYATYLGGNQSSTHVDGGTSRFDKSGIVYHSVCSGCRFYNEANRPTSDFPTTTGAWSQVNRSPNCNNAAFKFDLSTLKARLRTNSELRDQPGLRVVCIPDRLGFENFSTGGELYYWDFGDGTTEVRNDTAFITHQYKSPGQYMVTLSAVDHGTCQVVDQTSVLVTVHQARSFVQEDTDMCFGDSYRLQSGGGVAYWWRSADGSFTSGEATPLISPQDTATYYITLEEANGCIRKDTVQVNVVPAINPQFEWTKISNCTGRPQISVRNATDSLDSGDSWFFDFGDGTVSDSDIIAHAFDSDGVFDVRIITRREFCVFEKSVAIPVFEIFIPNVITPALQGHNDVFTIRFGQTDGLTPGSFGHRVSLSIYNRWGEQVYHSNDYQYDWSGTGLAAGTYFYEAAIEGHATCKSWVQLIK